MLAVQQTLADLGTPLREVPFVVVDLETTGGSPTEDRITEIGAVRIQGGEVVGELQTLVDPGIVIPPAIVALTGITDAMVARFPPVESILPTFLEFASGAALVAHNARFDTGFLNAGLARLDYPPLPHSVVCTAALARRLVRDEVRDCRLATLARLFRTRHTPTHRALDDARATVEVFHSLLERAGSFGVLTLEDLLDFAKVRNAPVFKSRRGLADGLPRSPGVYAFRSASGEVLYVGKATDLRARVRSYFGGDDRRWVAAMLRETERVEHWPCPTALEAGVRELRLLAERPPRFNRRSTSPGRAVWVALTQERYPRLTVTASSADDARPRLGPVSSRRAAARIVEALQDALPIRRCTARIGARTRTPACALAELGRCGAACEGGVDPERYAELVAPFRDALTGDPTPLLEPLAARMDALADTGRFEQAADVRDRLRALVAALRRTRRLAAAGAVAELVAARRVAGGHEVVLVRGGRLVGTARPGPGQGRAAVAALRAGAGPLDDAPAGPPPAGVAEEMELVLRWCDQDGVRVVAAVGAPASPWAGGAALDGWWRRLERVHRSTGRPAGELDAKRTRRSVSPSQPRLSPTIRA